MADRIRVSVTKMKYGWSKYGGARHGMVKEERHGSFYCQVCGKEQPNEMGRYMIPLDEDMREFAVVCGECKRFAISAKIEALATLSLLVRSLVNKEMWES